MENGWFFTTFDQKDKRVEYGPYETKAQADLAVHEVITKGTKLESLMFPFQRCVGCNS